MSNFYLQLKTLVNGKQYQKVMSMIKNLYGFDPNYYITIKQKTLLDECVDDDNANELVEFLLSKGCNSLSLFNKDIERPLSGAVCGGAIKNVRTLLRYKQSLTLEILEQSVEINNTEIFKLLLPKFPKESVTNSTSFIAHSITNENYEILDLLMDYYEKYDNNFITFVLLFMFDTTNMDILKYIIDKGYFLSTIKLNHEFLKSGMDYLNFSNEDNFINSLNYLKDECENFDDFMVSNREFFLSIETLPEDCYSIIHIFYETNY